MQGRIPPRHACTIHAISERVLGLSTPTTPQSHRIGDLPSGRIFVTKDATQTKKTHLPCSRRSKLREFHGGKKSAQARRLCQEQYRIFRKAKRFNATSPSNSSHVWTQTKSPLHLLCRLTVTTTTFSFHPNFFSNPNTN